MPNNSLALDESEGDRVAPAAGDADVVSTKHYGVLVLAPSIAKARDDLRRGTICSTSNAHAGFSAWLSPPAGLWCRRGGTSPR